MTKATCWAMASTSRQPFSTPKNTAQTLLVLIAVRLRPRTRRCPGWLHRRLLPSRCVPTWAIRSRLRMAPYGTRTPKLSRAHASNGDMPVPQWWAVAVEPRQSLRQRWPRRSIYKGQNRSIRGGFFIACMSSAAFAQMVNAGAGRLPSVYRGYTSCVP